MYTWNYTRSDSVESGRVFYFPEVSWPLSLHGRKQSLMLYPDEFNILYPVMLNKQGFREVKHGTIWQSP